MPGRQLLLSPIISTPEISQHSLHCGIKVLGPSDLARTLLEQRDSFTHEVCTLEKKGPRMFSARSSTPVPTSTVLHTPPLHSKLTTAQQDGRARGMALADNRRQMINLWMCGFYILQPWVHECNNLKVNIIKMAQRKGRHPPDLWWRY